MQSVQCQLGHAAKLLRRFLLNYPIMFKNVVKWRLIAIDMRISIPTRPRQYIIRVASRAYWSEKNENMQADVQSIQSTHHIYCPLCHAPLANRTSNDAIGITNQTSSSYVFCSSCGYTAPLISRQHAQSPQHQASNPSGWVDTTASTYLQGEQPLPPSSAVPASLGEPASPIPPRASAQHTVKVRPRYSYARTPESDESDLTRIPTLPSPTTWQYESQDFTAESSLSSLSLIVDAPTHPEIPGTRNTPHPAIFRIEEIDTHPSVCARNPSESTNDVAQRAIEEHDTIPTQRNPVRADRANGPNRASNVGASPLPSAASLFLGDAIAPVSANNPPSRALAPIVPAAMPVVFVSQKRQVASAEPVSWTAGAGAGSRYAQLVATRTVKPSRKRQMLSFNLFDHVSWHFAITQRRKLAYRMFTKNQTHATLRKICRIKRCASLFNPTNSL